MTTGEEASDCRDVLFYDGNGFVAMQDWLVREVPLEILLNGRRVITIACSGVHVAELAVGFLRSEGLLRTRDELTGLEVSSDGRQVRIRTAAADFLPALEDSPHRAVASSGARSLGPLLPEIAPAEACPGQVQVSPREAERLMAQFLAQAGIHDRTGGTHGTALALGGEILVVREDIGRHNALDMISGYAFLNGLDCRDAVILRTGRVSSEIVHKARRIGAPVVISLSVPTLLAVEIAREAGITLIGAVRGGGMKIYSHEGRVRK
jgi:FdhD protein